MIIKFYTKKVTYNLIKRKKYQSWSNFLKMDGKLTLHAKISEAALRFDDMLQDMKVLTGLGRELDCEQQNLLILSYRYAVNPRRRSLKKLNSIRNEVSPKQIDVLNKLYNKIVSEIESLCEEAIKISEVDVLLFITVYFFYKDLVLNFFLKQ